MLLCSRQSGKSTTTALLSLHGSLYKPNALVLLIAPALRQSQELFRTIQTSYAAIDGQQITPLVEESALRMEFLNG